MGTRGRPRHPDILTPRQFQVLELVRDGLTNPQIAERLGISPDGAKSHVQEIIWKLGVTSRREAARWRQERQNEAGARPTAHLTRRPCRARRPSRSPRRTSGSEASRRLEPWLRRGLAA